MKKINFSPYAKIVNSGRFWKKGIAFFGIGLAGIVLVVLVWFEQANFYQAINFSSLNQGQKKTKKAEIAENIEVKAPEKAEVKNDKEEKSVEKPAVEPYYLKVFSSVFEKEAEKVADYLRQAGFISSLVRESGSAMMYNLYLVPVSSMSEKAMLSRLADDGFLVYREEKIKGKYTYRLASCYYSESARSLLEDLKSRGYSGNIIQEKTRVNLYSLFLGPYTDWSDVLEVQKQLMLNGVVDGDVESFQSSVSGIQ